jgi:hypothetical protein
MTAECPFSLQALAHPFAWPISDIIEALHNGLSTQPRIQKRVLFHPRNRRKKDENATFLSLMAKNLGANERKCRFRRQLGLMRADLFLPSRWRPCQCRNQKSSMPLFHVTNATSAAHGTFDEQATDQKAISRFLPRAQLFDAAVFRGDRNAAHRQPYAWL